MTAAALAATIMSTPMSFDRRAQDWRLGAVVYQIFVDRFAPSDNLEAKKGLYTGPQTLRKWTETPKATPYDPVSKTYPHVFEFWGGDLKSLMGKLDYVQNLGADVVYLNPIFKAPSNHKYDTADFFQVDPQYGSNQDLLAIQKELHRRKMKLMLDGVFNHSGDQWAPFIEAQKDPKSSKRDWFFFGSEYEKGYRGWAGVASLPALKLENPEVAKYFWGSKDSVVQSYLRNGLDGWRLDVAFELGPDLLIDLNKSAKKARKDSVIVGEISGYPSQWDKAVDGTFNFFAINIAIEMLRGRVEGGDVGRMYDDMVKDAGIDQLLRSWLLTDNHDTPRFASVVKDAESRHLLRLLQLTLPGSPCLYYGSELGMTGTGDPECRAPMRWDWVKDDNPDLVSTRQLLNWRKKLPALRYGDFMALRSDELLAFARVTDKLRETVIVVMNPTDEPVKEAFASRQGRILSWGEMQDLVTGKKYRSITGILDLEVPAKSAMILVPSTDKFGGYSPYDRVP